MAYKYLTEELLQRLIDTHRGSRDFRNVTACRCDVHPHALTKWLKRGALNEEDGLYSRLLVEFGQIEGDHRAELIAEVVNTEVERTVVETDPDGNETKTTIKRNASGVQWFLSKRYRQFQEKHDNEKTGDESDVSDLVVQLAQQMPAANTHHIIAQFASIMPEELRLPFEAWATAALPQGQDGTP